MKNIITFDEFVNESLLLESFVSLKLAEFKAEFIKGDHNKALPRGIRWDLINDNEIIGFDEPGFTKKDIGKNDEWVVFWYSPKKQLVKWRQDTYTKWGSKKENSIYMRPGTLLITRGLNFLHGWGLLSSYKVASERYEKPLDGALAVSKLFDGQFQLNAFAIKWSTLQQYSADSLIKDRSNAKNNALALMKSSDILKQNHDRYQTAIAEGKLNRESKSVAIRVERVAEMLKNQIENAGKITFSELVNFRKSTYSKDDQMLTAYINRIDYTKIERYVSDYNELINAYNSWYKEFKSYINSPHSDFYKRWADDRLKDLEKILVRY